MSRADMRDLRPRRVFLAESRLFRREVRRFLAVDFLPLSARATLLRDALLREELAGFLFPKTVPEKATVIRTNRISAKRRYLG